MNLLGRYASDDEDTNTVLAKRAKTVFARYASDDEDTNTVLAKRAKTVFADLSEDDREIASRTMPAKLMFDGHSWKCSTRVHSQKDDGWTAYYTCCNTECEARMIVKTTRDFRLVLCNKFAILVTHFIF